MRHDATLLHSPFSPGDALKNQYSALLVVKGLHINEIRGGSAVFSDEHRVPIFLNFGDQARGLSFESRDEFHFHGDTIVSLDFFVNWRRTSRFSGFRAPARLLPRKRRAAGEEYAGTDGWARSCLTCRFGRGLHRNCSEFGIRNEKWP